MKLVINKKKWLRGTGGGLLRNRAGKMCCLGFLAGACNVKGITNKGMPTDLRNQPSKPNIVWNKMIKFAKNGTVCSDSKLADRLAIINDNVNTSDAVKEIEIIKNFKKIDVDVTFKN